jgi:antimicrobial peptide system SdpB family protein
MFGYSLGTFISVIILLAVLTGYYPRITIIFQTWVHLSLCNTLILIEGGDQVASNLSLLLIPICILDSRKNQWDNSTINNNEQINIFSNIYYFLIRLQIAVIYLHAGIGKLAREEWLDGTCLYYWCTHSVFGAPNYLQKIFSIITLSKFTPIFSWAVIFLEIGLFSCILATNKSIKRFFLFSGVLFHFGIMLTHGLVTFFCSMVGALILYLDNENIIYKICKTIKYKIHGIKL